MSLLRKGREVELMILNIPQQKREVNNPSEPVSINLFLAFSSLFYSWKAILQMLQTCISGHPSP